MSLWSPDRVGAASDDRGTTVFRGQIDVRSRQVKTKEVRLLKPSVLTSEADWGEVKRAASGGAKIVFSWPVGGTRFDVSSGAVGPNCTEPVDLGGKQFCLTAQADCESVCGFLARAEKAVPVRAVEPLEIAVVRPFADLSSAGGALFVCRLGGAILFAQLWKGEPIFFRATDNGADDDGQIVRQALRTVEYLTERYSPLKGTLCFTLGEGRDPLAKALSASGLRARPVSLSDCWDGSPPPDDGLSIAAFGLAMWGMS